MCSGWYGKVVQVESWPSVEPWHPLTQTLVDQESGLACSELGSCRVGLLVAHGEEKSMVPHLRILGEKKS